MSPSETAKLLIGIGFLIIAVSAIFGIANISGLLEKKKKSRRYVDFRLASFDDEDESNPVFKRHGIAMIGIVIGMIFFGIAAYVGGIDLVKEVLRQFGVHV